MLGEKSLSWSSTTNWSHFSTTGYWITLAKSEHSQHTDSPYFGNSKRKSSRISMKHTLFTFCAKVHTVQLFFLASFIKLTLAGCQRNQAV